MGEFRPRQGAASRVRMRHEVAECPPYCGRWIGLMSPASRASALARHARISFTTRAGN